MSEVIKEDVTLDEDRQQTAKEYSRIGRRLMLVELVLGAAYLLVWLITSWHLAAREWVQGMIEAPAIEVILFVIIFAVPYMLIDLPLSYYSGYVLPHRYGQSNQTLGNWIGDLVKGLVLSALLGVIVLEVIYWLLRAAPDLWWLYAGGVMLLFTVVLATLAPVLVMPLFFKFVPLDDEDLTGRLVRLAEQAGTTVKGVFRFDMSTKTKGANAAVMGLGSTRRIVLGDTLLDEFTADEIETVLAHELGHHVHRDMPLGVVINSVLTLVTFFAAHLILTWGMDVLGLQSIADPAGMPLFALVGGALGLVAMPLSNGYSRWRERMADRYALETTGKPEAFSSAMTRLANQNLADVNPERWVVILLHSHPPIGERVAMAEQFNGT